jgi:ribosomal protein S27E
MSESDAVLLQKTETKIASLEKQLAAVRTKREGLLRERTITCPKCHGVFPLRDLTFLHEHFYISPSGCTEGDYWTSSSSHSVRCCGCGMCLRLLSGGVSTLNPYDARKYFKSVEDLYERH